MDRPLHISAEDLRKALDDFDPNWQMLCGDLLSLEDHEFLASCNVSWEYNNKEENEDD